MGADLGTLAASTTKGAFRKDDESRFVPNVLIEDNNSEKKVMLLVVIGGVSLVEVAAVRYLSSDPSFPFRIIVASTKIINGTTLLTSLEHDFDA
jgi:hypothetical protein